MLLMLYAEGYNILSTLSVAMVDMVILQRIFIILHYILAFQSHFTNATLVATSSAPPTKKLVPAHTFAYV